MPNISVIIATYQRADLVSQAIDSVLAQTYTDYKIIVINNGSTDNTKQVLASFGEQITVIHLDSNTGSAAGAQNVGIMAARGRYIAFLDDDDLWLPNKLEKQIAYLESNPKVGLVYSDTFFIDDKGVCSYTFAQINNILPFEQIWTLFVRCPIPTPSIVLVRRECLDEVGGFNATLGPAYDYDMWFRIVEKFPVYFLNEPLALYRKHATSLSSDPNNLEMLLVSTLRVKEKAFSRNPHLQQLPKKFLDQHFYNAYLTLAYFYIERYQGQKARLTLACYQQLRGITSASKWLWMISFPLLSSSPISDRVTQRFSPSDANYAISS